MREVLVEGERFSDAMLLHDQEAETVHRAVARVPVPGEVGEGLLLLVQCCGVDAREVAAVEPFDAATYWAGSLATAVSYQAPSATAMLKRKP